MRSLYGCILLVLLSSCWNDDLPFDFKPEQALTGTWEVSEGVFLWDNNTRISTINPVFESLPSVSMEFADSDRFLVRYSFIVTDNDDSVTFANGLQEGAFDLMVDENTFLSYNGIITFTENTTNTTDESDIRFILGNEVDTLWIENMALNNLLDGEVTGIFVRKNQ
ncbi:MAG: hypothetical protein OER04_00135 [Cyclobacteriaceae bacterium]|nr:hypothetical protein [Cyclobacteriaceae bacterium]